MNELSNWIPDSKIIAPKEVDRKFFRGAPARTSIQKRSSGDPRNHNSEALSVDARPAMTTGRAFQLQQDFEPATYCAPTNHLGSPLEAACFIACHCGRRSPLQAASKDLPPLARVPTRAFPAAREAPLKRSDHFDATVKKILRSYEVHHDETH